MKKQKRVGERTLEDYLNNYADKSSEWLILPEDFV